MIKRVHIAFMTSAILLFSSCASIVSRTSYPVTIKSSPTQANISITDRHGNSVYSGKTPAIVNLKSGGGFFKRGIYKVIFQKEGQLDREIYIRASLDGWYWGNLVFGGLIGFFLVDPGTGAMYKIDTRVINEQLSDSFGNLDDQRLHIYDINEVPESWKQHLVQVETLPAE